MKQIAAAFLLLLLGMLWNNVWKWVPEQHGGRVFVAGSGLFIAALLTAWMFVTSSRAMHVVCLLLIGFALQVSGCNLWFIFDPWVIDQRDELCSSRMGLPLGMVGLWAATMVTQWLYLRGKHGNR